MVVSEHVSEISSDFDGQAQLQDRKRKRREIQDDKTPVLGLSELIQFKNTKEVTEANAADPLRRSSLEANFMLEDIDSFP